MEHDVKVIRLSSMSVSRENAKYVRYFFCILLDAYLEQKANRSFLKIALAKWNQEAAVSHTIPNNFQYMAL